MKNYCLNEKSKVIEQLKEKKIGNHDRKIWALGLKENKIYVHKLMPISNKRYLNVINTPSYILDYYLFNDIEKFFFDDKESSTYLAGRYYYLKKNEKFPTYTTVLEVDKEENALNDQEIISHRILDYHLNLRRILLNFYEGGENQNLYLIKLEKILNKLLIDNKKMSAYCELIMNDDDLFITYSLYQLFGQLNEAIQVYHINFQKNHNFLEKYVKLLNLIKSKLDKKQVSKKKIKKI